MFTTNIGEKGDHVRALICSVADIPNEVPFVAPRLPEASFMLPVRGAKERFVSVWCNDSTDYEDRGFDSPRQETRYSGKDTVNAKGEVVPGIATQLLFPAGANGPTWRDRGVFIAAGDTPTEEELKAAEKARDTHRRRLVDDARFFFQKHRHSRGIADDAFWAAERMGLEEDWMPLAANPCPSCGIAVKSDAAVCHRCHLIMDEKKYAEFKFAGAPIPVQIAQPQNSQHQNQARR